MQPYLCVVIIEVGQLLRREVTIATSGKNHRFSPEGRRGKRILQFLQITERI